MVGIETVEFRIAIASDAVPHLTQHDDFRRNADAAGRERADDRAQGELHGPGRGPTLRLYGRGHPFGANHSVCEGCVVDEGSGREIARMQATMIALPGEVSREPAG